MPSSYSTNLKIELQATGENSGTWGTITNTNLGTALEQAIIGYGNPNYLSDANLTLTYTDTNSAQTARALVLNVTSALSLTGTRELVVPTIQKQYIVQNNTTGGQSITVKTSAGTGITVPNGRKAHLYVNGTDVIYMDDYVDINGGAIDGTPVGANSASTGAFSTLSATGNVNFDGGTFTFNDSGADKDFRVEGDTDANLLFSDASTDRIGIGTNTPASKLDVNGTITATAVNTTTLDLTNLEVTNIKAKDGTSAASIADSTGVVSFTANPILSGGTANGVLYLDGSKVATSGSVFTFDGTNARIGGSGSGARLTVRGTGTTASTFSFEAATSGGATRFLIADDGLTRFYGTSNAETMRLDNAGNLGIGTSSPVAKLSVQDASVPKFALQVGSAERAFLSYTESNFTTRLDSDGPLVFAANNAEAGRFDISGNLGIGTSSPGHRLDVVGDAKIRPSSGYNALFEVSGSALRINYLNDALSANVSAAFRAADFVFQTAGATERARITADGNIVAGGSSALATTATNGFLYVPTCAGTPTGTPTAITGMAPIVVNTTNNKLYFYSGGAWRDAGP